jgi:hypothetical protein
MKKINLKFGVIALGIALTTYACKKSTTLSDDTSDGVELSESANDDGMADAIMAEFGEDVDTTSLILTRGPLKCRKHTVTRYTDSIIVNTDFGLTEQVCEDSVIRKGKVTAKYYFKPSKKQLDSIRYTTNDYYRNKFGVKGTKLVVFKDLNTYGLVIANILNLVKFEAVELGELFQLEEAKENYAAPIVIQYTGQEVWTVAQQGPILKRVNLSSYLP